MAAYYVCGDSSDMVDFIMLAVCGLMGLTKITTFRVHMKKIRIVFCAAIDDWLDIEDTKSRNIIIPFAKTGRSVFFLQMVFSYMTNILLIISALPFLQPPATNETSWLENAFSLYFVFFVVAIIFTHLFSKHYCRI